MEKRRAMISLCINLDSRPDRWEQVTKEFERIGFAVERFRAITGNNRCLAFNKSVYHALGLGETIGEDKHGDPCIDYEPVLLFEDDVVFDTPIPLILPPENYMTIHLGCNIIGTDTTVWQMPTAYNRTLAKLHNCWQSHATLYSAECVKYIIENFKYVTDEYEKEGLMIFDEWLRTNVLTMGRSYVLKPMIAYQRPDFSNIWNVAADYTGAHKQGNEWLKRNL